MWVLLLRSIFLDLCTYFRGPCETGKAASYCWLGANQKGTATLLSLDVSARPITEFSLATGERLKRKALKETSVGEIKRLFCIIFVNVRS